MIAPILGCLRSRRFPHGNEATLQRSVADAFDAAGIVYEREVRLTERDRIDFVVGRVGIECKIGGSVADVAPTEEAIDHAIA